MVLYLPSQDSILVLIPHVYMSEKSRIPAGTLQ